ncbi:Tannase/feruloyl esterase [Aspergillus cavernicola]|uniref:Carboxylic ester hydrolase n=1 Tax=Aspergillus cavernicola TaxID=176166 RepID=A0ABR4I0Y8_9EURO
MKHIPIFQFCALALLSISAIAETNPFQERCTSFPSSLDIKIPKNATVLSSTFISPGTTLPFPHNDPTCTRPSQLVNEALCRAALNVTTSQRSRVSVEVWLPEQWSGRFLSTGNAGLGGCIAYEDMEYAASLGFATVGTNNGHDGMIGESFLGNLDTIEDFAYRALRVGVVVGKQVSRAFYGKYHTKSYYLGCSTGGRQGFKEAQMFPDDFDGIVAGALAFSFNNLTSWSCHFYPLTGPEGSPTFVPLSMWSRIHEDILNQCDGIDGVQDGIIESPDLCNYNPNHLICAQGQTNQSNCLTPQQAETVNSIFSPLLGIDGSLVYPRMQPGSEMLGAAQGYYSGTPFGAADWFRYAIFNTGSSWDPLTLSTEDYALAAHMNFFNIETWEGDLSAFQNRGSKILHYHGLVDQTISSDNSARYYEHFYRYFRISGMAHCGGGLGASFIGNSRRSAASLHADENVLMAMVRWVEDGIAPDTITGSAYVNGTANGEPDFKRRHCRWPYRNVYQNSGDPKDAANWKCI